MLDGGSIPLVAANQRWRDQILLQCCLLPFETHLPIHQKVSRPANGSGLRLRMDCPNIQEMECPADNVRPGRNPMSEQLIERH